MNETIQRMTDGGKEPDAKSLSAWLGTVSYKRWTRLCQYIEANYPGVFVPEWLFGGKKYGWGLRFKKSKSFCTLIPERNKLVVQIVFGAKERKEAEAILDTLGPDVCDAYRKAPTYHDGKWLGRAVTRYGMLGDIERLLSVKRRPAKLGSNRRNQAAQRESQ